MSYLIEVEFRDGGISRHIVDDLAGWSVQGNIDNVYITKRDSGLVGNVPFSPISKFSDEVLAHRERTMQSIKDNKESEGMFNSLAVDSESTLVVKDVLHPTIITESGQFYVLGKELTITGFDRGMLREVTLDLPTSSSGNIKDLAKCDEVNEVRGLFIKK